jgi:hypothetical protein
VTPAEIREAYLQWTRRAMPTLALPLALTGLMQCASFGEWWSAGPQPSGSARYLFLAVAVAGVVVGRNVRDRETEIRPLSIATLTSLSWRLLTYALAPVAIGAVLAFMTRQMWDFYTLLLVTLVGLGVLYPRYDQWLAWSRPREERSE